MVTFSTPTVVAVKIRGEAREFPVVSDDGGLVWRFLEWCMGQGIHSVIPAGFSGGGGYLGFHLPEDAVKIRAWLVEDGAVEDDEKAWARR